MKKQRRLAFLMIISMSVILFVACNSKENEIKKIKDLEFTVVAEEEIPEELKTIIDEKKQNPFKLTYSDKENLYIVVGYGEQQTGGYSITVDDLYLADNAIYINTSLAGPPKEEKVTQALTYPYIVIKTEAMDKSVVFD